MLMSTTDTIVGKKIASSLGWPKAIPSEPVISDAT